jgi:DNA-binding CsgD family transcriptional regulator
MKTWQSKCRLSARQAEILRILCGEAPATKDMAARLGLAHHTVDAYIDEMVRILCLGSRQRLIIWALQHPEAMSGEWCDPDLHPPGCSCAGAFCGILRALHP